MYWLEKPMTRYKYFLEKIDYQKPELNPCCFVVYIRRYLTRFWRGQRRSDFITFADICKVYKYNFHFNDVVRSPTDSLASANHSLLNPNKLSQNWPISLWRGLVIHWTSVGVYTYPSKTVDSFWTRIVFNKRKNPQFPMGSHPFCSSIRGFWTSKWT